MLFNLIFFRILDSLYMFCLFYKEVNVSKRYSKFRPTCVVVCTYIYIPVYTCDTLWNKKFPMSGPKSHEYITILETTAVWHEK